MSAFDFVKKILSGKKEKDMAPIGLCPNCWGRQEYEGNFLEAVKNENIDLNNINEKKGWIQEYATKNFEGIKLKKTNDLLECQACKLTYK